MENESWLLRRRIFLFLLLALSLATPAFGSIFIVTDTNDTLRTTSLRGAIMWANRFGGRNTIVLGRPAGRGKGSLHVYHLTIHGQDEANARTGDLNITRGNLSIMGVGSNITVDATGLGDRVFQVSHGAQLTLQNLTITGGTAPNGGFSYDTYPGPPGESGGAIYNAGNLVMQNCVLYGNTCGIGGPLIAEVFGIGGKGGDGGGFYNSGTVVLNSCLIRNNMCGVGCGHGNDLSVIFGGSGGSGGGIFNTGKIRLNFCTVENNYTGSGGDGGDYYYGGSAGTGGNGAGIFSAGSLVLNTCTLSGNRCGMGGIGGSGDYVNPAAGGGGGDGGGIYNTGATFVSSCTIVSNSSGAGGNGGGIWWTQDEFPPAGNGGPGGNGGGILNAGTNAFILRNNLIALNSADNGGQGGTNVIYVSVDGGGQVVTNLYGNPGTNGFGPDVCGAFASSGFNLISAADGGVGITNGINGDLTGTVDSPIDPLIGPLQMNGGFTPTHALLPNSPAINQGNSFGIHTDQRGHHRPFKYPGIPDAKGSDGSDIGAFELDAVEVK